MRINVYKREGKRGVRWYLDYFWGGSRRRYPVADTRAVAEEIKARIQIQVSERTFKGPQTHEEQRAEQTWTFGQLCDEWYAVRKPRIRPATQEFYTEILKGLKAHFGKDRPSAAIGSLDCRKFLAAKRAESDSPVRANRNLTVLRSVFALAVEEEWIDRDPTKKLRKEREQQKETFLSGEQMTALVEACDPWLRPIVLTAYYTGARRGDLVGDNRASRGKPPLTWVDVDLAGRRITFRHTKEKKTRSVRIGAELLPLLFSLPSKPGDGERLAEKPVFVDDRGKPITADRAYKRFKVAAKATGIEGADKLRFHDLRHSTVSGLVGQGYSLQMIQSYMGHSTPYMTQRYAHIADKQLDTLADGLSGTISPHAGAVGQKGR